MGAALRPDDIEPVLALGREGYEAAHIARETGRTLSSVYKILQTAGLSRRGEKRPRRGGVPRKVMPVAEAAGLDTALAERPPGLGLFDLSATTCRFPLAGPGGLAQRFCGAPCDRAQPYCEACARRAFVPSARRAAAEAEIEAAAKLGADEARLAA